MHTWPGISEPFFVYLVFGRCLPGEPSKTIRNQRHTPCFRVASRPPEESGSKVGEMRNADDTIRWNSSWRRASYPSSSFFFDRDSGAAYRWADGRGIITKQELLEWGESRYGGQRVTLQRVRGSESGEGRREKSEMKRACRIALFKPNKICGITSQICRVVDARTFLLYICRRGNDGRRGGWMYVYACVCIYVCMCAWREERTMSTADGSWGRNDVRLEPGLKWENAPGNAPANCQPTLQRSLRIDVATVRNYSCPLLATFQRIGNSLWNSWNWRFAVVVEIYTELTRYCHLDFRHRILSLL